jgi:CheY-like chemotaxis protein
MSIILVVEDNEDIREAVAEMLRQEGHEVCEAENGKEALNALEAMAKPPCLVLLDLMMPVMSGVELLKILDESKRLATLPVVVVSAAHERPTSLPGNPQFIRKPPSYELLKKLVHEFCPEH